MVLRKLIAVLLCLSLGCPGYAQGEKYVALTLDDGPSGRFTQTLLAGLEERQVQATFLLCGYRIREYPAQAEAIFAQGHEIGLHGYSHGCMKDMCREELDREIADTLALLPEGCRPAFLRPPGGKCSQAVTEAARQAGLALLGWSVDPRDWASHDAATIRAAVVRQVKSGDVVLLHDMSWSSVEAALMIVDALKAQGFTFLTVSALAQQTNTQILPGRLYTRF